MKSYCLLLVVASIVIALPAAAAPAGPITAGTAPGPLTGRTANIHYPVGIHYPINWTALATMPNGTPPHPTNRTAPYDEWSDPGLVRGHRPAMTSDICVIASHRRGTPHKEAST
jgi:hypothetical protein